MIWRRTTRFLIGSLAVLVAVFSMGGVAFAQTLNLSQDKLDTIKSRCSNSQFALEQIERRDAVSRINRGRAYDQLLRQISAFNSRFAYNKISSPDLLQITSDIETAVDSFRSDYDTYDNDITSALHTDCKNDPRKYYEHIVQARVDRAAIGTQVQVISDLTEKYRAALVIYQEGL